MPSGRLIHLWAPGRSRKASRRRLGGRQLIQVSKGDACLAHESRSGGPFVTEPERRDANRVHCLLEISAGRARRLQLAAEFAAKSLARRLIAVCGLRALKFIRDLRSGAPGRARAEREGERERDGRANESPVQTQPPE